MSTIAFYRAQAIQQQSAADSATLDKVRGRCQEAADSWAVFADRMEKRAALRVKLSTARALSEPNENPDRGRAAI